LAGTSIASATVSFIAMAHCRLAIFYNIWDGNVDFGS
jgi:hypothetical protein